jgi:hypothetical protein
MTLDQAIQHMILKSTDSDLESLECLARKERDETISRYQVAYGWTIAECNEFLDNAALAYELLVKDKAA